jgi:hypothetical protein
MSYTDATEFLGDDDFKAFRSEGLQGFQQHASKFFIE